MSIIYGIIAIVATTIGAITGVGGGVIIKPIMDIFGKMSILNIGILSSVTVFTMSIVSILKQRKQSKFINKKISLVIGISSILGGFIGEYILKIFVHAANRQNLVNGVQNIIMIILLVFVYKFNGKKLIKNSFKKSKTNFFIVSLLLGIFASFLSVGGGPINVAAFTIFFGMSLKEATINSIITIFFSQASKLVTVILAGGFLQYNLNPLPYMLIAAVLGGYIGSNLNKNFSNDKLGKLFSYMLIGVCFLNVYNLFKLVF